MPVPGESPCHARSIPQGLHQEGRRGELWIRSSCSKSPGIGRQAAPFGIGSGYVYARPRAPSRPLPTLPPGARYSGVGTGVQGRRAVAVWLPRRGRQARLQPPVDAPPTSAVALKLGSLVLLLRRREGHPRLLPALPDLGGHRAPWAPSAGLPAGLRCLRAVSGRRPFPACCLCFRSPGRPGREGRRAPRCPDPAGRGGGRGGAAAHHQTVGAAAGWGCKEEAWASGAELGREPRSSPMAEVPAQCPTWCPTGQHCLLGQRGFSGRRGRERGRGGRGWGRINSLSDRAGEEIRQNSRWGGKLEKLLLRTLPFLFQRI